MANETASATSSDFTHLNATTDLSAIIRKAAAAADTNDTNATASASPATSAASSERDAGFCSGSSDIGDDYQRDSDHSGSPNTNTDASQSSVDVGLDDGNAGGTLISKNKRKTMEPTRVVTEFDYPPKKRHKFEFSKRIIGNNNNNNENANNNNNNNNNTNLPISVDTSASIRAIEPPTLISPIQSESGASRTSAHSPNPFRPWAATSDSQTTQPNPADDPRRHPAVTTQHRCPEPQDQPLALIKKQPNAPSSSNNRRPVPFSFQPTRLPSDFKFTDESSLSSVQPTLVSGFASILNQPPPEQHHTPTLLDLTTTTRCSSISPEESHDCKPLANLADPSMDDDQQPNRENDPEDEQSQQLQQKLQQHEQQQQLHPSHRNYKNMTRERRIEANARERTRVHTISAAFETLRKSVPSYAHSQKLSKLSVLRVACSYILTLSRMAGDDYSADHSEPSINECADEVTRTIQTEGKVRKKKDE